MLTNRKVRARAQHLGEMTDSEWLRHRRIEIDRGVRAAHRERAQEIKRCFRGLVGLVRR